MSDVTVGLDIGTTSVKAVAVNGDGDGARPRPHPARRRHPVSRLVSSTTSTWRGATGVVDALASVAEGLEVAAVNVAAMVPSLGAVDDRRTRPRTRPAVRRLRGASVWATTRPSRATAVSCSRSSRGRPSHIPTRTATGRRRPWPTTRCAASAPSIVSTAMTAHPLYDYTDWDEAMAKEAGTSVEQAADDRRRLRPGGNGARRPRRRWRAGGRGHDRRVRRAARGRRRRRRATCSCCAARR